MVATVRCEEIANEKLSGLVCDKVLSLSLPLSLSIYIYIYVCILLFLLYTLSSSLPSWSYLSSKKKSFTR